MHVRAAIAVWKRLPRTKRELGTIARHFGKREKVSVDFQLKFRSGRLQPEVGGGLTWRDLDLDVVG